MSSRISTGGPLWPPVTLLKNLIAGDQRWTASQRAAMLLVCAFTLAIVGAATQCAMAPTSPQFSAQEEAFLEDLSHRSFLFFWEQADPGTGLVRDRAGTDGSGRGNVASIAATGFGLTALCIGAERGWVNADEARERVRIALRFFAERAYHQHGWFYHWMDAATGERAWQSEVSSIDSALLLGGVLTVRQYFKNDSEIVRWATTIYERVDFQWMLNGHPTLLSHGWKPETGFLASRWDTYSEHMILYLLAIGSPTRPIAWQAWYEWWRMPITYAGYAYATNTGWPALFIHQYSHAWIDFRNRREDKGTRTNWFENSIAATRAHRAFCIDLSREFPSYSENVWGITSSDSAKGYVAWGGPPRFGPIDGTVVPCAAGGSLMFTRDISLPALQTMRDRFSTQFGERLYGRYGFTDAFNPLTGWIDSDVIGIDVGITLLSAENLRSGNVWRWFMNNPEIDQAMRLIGLRTSAP